MNYHNNDDDGNFMTGVIMTGLVFTSAIAGYWVRDIGITVKIQAPAI